MKSDSSDKIVFDKEFTLQEALPDAAIERAVELMKNGRLHRYNTAADELSETAVLETEYADYVGSRYCVGFSSCGSSIYVALKSVGVTRGDLVLCNAFTLAPVPGAIENAGARHILVEITEDYVTDLTDLERKAAATGAKFFLLSHMRGHIVDMDAVTDLCRRRGIVLIEDCAHTMGARWGDRFTGTFGKAGCFSTQTYKHINSGEGGLLVSDDEQVVARAILYSGSYMLYERHLSRPAMDVFAPIKGEIPNFSLRMSNLQAALIRPQLENLDHRCRRWNERYAALAEALHNVPHIRIPRRPAKEHFVGSSFQFTLEGVTVENVRAFLDECGARGVEIKWFGAKEPVGFTSSWEHWAYIEAPHDLPRTRKILDFLCDFRVPLTFSIEDCRILATVIRQVAQETFDRETRPADLDDSTTKPS